MHSPAIGTARLAIMQGTTTKKLLFHCQAIITAKGLRRLVNLNLGITLWHQGEETVLCGSYVTFTAERGRVTALNCPESESSV